VFPLRSSAWQPFARPIRQYGETATLAVMAGPTREARVQIEVVRPGCLVALRGRLSSTSVGDVRTALSDAIEAGVDDIVVDMSGVELMDATGLGVLVGSHRRAERAGRRLVLHNVPERIERLLLATRLHRVLCVDRLTPAAG
jgi:anti-sigma B factor antagonist